MEKLNLLISSEIASKLKSFAPLKLAYKRFLQSSVIVSFVSLTPAPKNVPRTPKIAWRLSHEISYIETFHTNS